jgi:hypothetical protein
MLWVLGVTALVGGMLERRGHDILQGLFAGSNGVSLAAPFTRMQQCL